MQEEQLRELKNLTTLNRYLHGLKKEENTRDMLSRNKNSAFSVKNYHRESEESFKAKKKAEIDELKRRNLTISRNNKLKN